MHDCFKSNWLICLRKHMFCMKLACHLFKDTHLFMKRTFTITWDNITMELLISFPIVLNWMPFLLLNWFRFGLDKLHINHFI